MVSAEKYGASTRTVLREFGYSESQIGSMIASGAVSESWSRDYLPG
jgi:crotonobetainyl-CoA:carnitine CoA-transferase CaiB-like acyl-CoA transferase